MSSSNFEDVREFHLKILGHEDSVPHLLRPLDMSQRVAFMEEEIEEMGEAYIKGDIVKVADAIADLIYVAHGTAHLMGLDMDVIWKAVHTANMQKVRGITKRGMEFDAVKPADWVGPETAIYTAIYKEM